MLLQQLARLVARVVGLLDRARDLLAPLVDHLLDRAERHRLSTKNVIRKATIVQIISPGVTWMRAFDASIDQTRT